MVPAEAPFCPSEARSATAVPHSGHTGTSLPRVRRCHTQGSTPAGTQKRSPHQITQPRDQRYSFMRRPWALAHGLRVAESGRSDVASRVCR